MGDKHKHSKSHTVDVGRSEVDGASAGLPVEEVNRSYKSGELECLFNEKSMQAAVVSNGQTLVSAHTLEKNSAFWDNAFGITATFSNPENTLTVNPSENSCIVDGINGGKEIPMKKMNFQFGSP